MSQQGRLVDNLTALETLSGNSGGPVPPDGTGDINVIGAGAVNVAGNPGTNTLTITVTGGGVPWNVVTDPTENLIENEGYIASNAGGVTFTLPATATVGSIIRVTGILGNWVVAQNAAQTIHFGNQSTTTGVGGSLTATDARDVVELLCVITNNDFQVLSSIGNITVT